jgi:hypothetical protein
MASHAAGAPMAPNALASRPVPRALVCTNRPVSVTCSRPSTTNLPTVTPRYMTCACTATRRRACVYRSMPTRARGVAPLAAPLLLLCRRAIDCSCARTALGRAGQCSNKSHEPAAHPREEVRLQLEEGVAGRLPRRRCVLARCVVRREQPVERRGRPPRVLARRRAAAVRPPWPRQAV